MNSGPGEVAEPTLGSAWIRAGVVVLATRILFLVLAYAGSYFLSPDTEGAPELGFFDIWLRWEGIRFLAVADHGYVGPESTPNATAFFPLFPLLLRALTAIGIPGVLAGMLISAVASWVALAYLYLLSEEHGRGTGRRAVLYLALFPTAVFLIAPYSESLFLAGAIAAFYYARRERWHLVGIPAAVAMGARFAGVFLLAGLVVEFLRQRPSSPARMANASLSVLIGLLPLLGYAAFLSQAKGDPFYFFVDQRLGWGRAFTGPLASLATSIGNLDLTDSANMMMSYRLELAGAAFGIALVGWAMARREWGYAAFMGLTMAALLTSTEYMSVPRIVLTFFPAAIFMASWTREKEDVHGLYLAATTCLMAVGVLTYTRGLWFF